MKIKFYVCANEHPHTKIPLGLGYLITNCAPEAEVVQNSALLEGADLVGVSTAAWGVREAVEIAQRWPGKIVVGGQGALWEGLDDYPFKHIVVGEGEWAFNHILQGLEMPKRIQYDPIGDIDSLKFPDRGVQDATVPILTARGCPFSCYFCSSKAFWGKVRYHSAEYFMEEVKYLLNRYPHMRTLYILDDLFIANRGRFNQIYKMWMTAGLNRRLGLLGFIRSSMFDRDYGEKMKAMGFSRVRFGAESASDRLLEAINKRATVADHQRTIDLANQLGLKVSASFMYDLPGETDEDRRLTKEFVDRNLGKLQIEGWYRFKAFPGTKYWEPIDLTTADMRVR